MAGLRPAGRDLRGVDGVRRQGCQLGPAQLPLLPAVRAAGRPARAGFLRGERPKLPEPDRLLAVLPDGQPRLAQRRGCDRAGCGAQPQRRAPLPRRLHALCAPAAARSMHVLLHCGRVGRRYRRLLDDRGRQLPRSAARAAHAGRFASAARRRLHRATCGARRRASRRRRGAQVFECDLRAGVAPARVCPVSPRGVCIRAGRRSGGGIVRGPVVRAPPARVRQSGVSARERVVPLPGRAADQPDRRALCAERSCRSARLSIPHGDARSIRLRGELCAGPALRRAPRGRRCARAEAKRARAGRVPRGRLAGARLLRPCARALARNVGQRPLRPCRAAPRGRMSRASRRAYAARARRPRRARRAPRAPARGDVSRVAAALVPGRVLVAPLVSLRRAGPRAARAGALPHGRDPADGGNRALRAPGVVVRQFPRTAQRSERFAAARGSARATSRTRARPRP